MRRSSQCEWLLAGLLGALPACSPMTHNVDTGNQDLIVPRDFAVPDMIDQCQNLGGALVQNAGFEGVAAGTVLNTEDGKAGALEPWRGCCTTNSGGTPAGMSTWSVSTDIPRCGSRSILLQGTGSRQNVFFQNLTLSGATPGQGFEFAAYIYIKTADSTTSPSLQLDVLDLGVSPGVVVASSPVQSRPSTDWVRLVAAGTVPNHGAPNPPIQLRFNNSGTMKAFLDDASLTLK